MSIHPKKHKLLHISHLYPTKSTPYLGSFMYELHSSLSQKIDTHFLVPTPKTIPFTKRWFSSQSPLLHPKAHRIFYYSIPKRKLPSITKGNLLRAFDKKASLCSYHIIHLNWSYPEPLFLPEIKKMTNAPVLLTLHGFMYYDVFRNPDLKSHLTKALNTVDRILTVGKQLRVDLIADFPMLEDKIFHLPNGVNKNKFKLFDSVKAKQSLGWSQDRKQVLCVANIAKEKGIDVLVDAISMSEALKEVDFHLIGRTIDPLTLDYVSKSIRELDNIYLHGPVDHAKLPEYYAAADAFVLPSRSEGFGIVLVEAGMSGVPLIGTRSGGPQEIITPENGLLCKADNAGDLANTIEKMIGNIHQYAPKRIRASMTNRFSQTSITQQLLTHYNDLVI